ncbi:hypothetical protein GWK47_050703 [Chionoecetes opilio]|uniref:Uncharacterized protein n=1 Tax=Chionoecetes opilio TaxID=41210 RepID=A0A8J4Y2Q4_CHIOP|nr:hypothetical protein GWK47_050703 [Chionoecetes opilio]
MVPDSYGKLHPRLIREEHVSVTEEPSGTYLWHFVPEDPVPPEKPAFKVAQALYDLLVTYDSTDSLIVLQGDSTRANMGWKGGTHAHLEKMLGRKLFWSICVLHTNELPLRHLITSINGPTSSDTGFTGPVCSLLFSVNEMQYNAEFRGVPGGEDLTEIPEYILVNMSTDQQVSYQRVQAVKRGVLPSELQEIKCGKVYFKLYYNIKVHHRLEDGPKHILTQLRVMRSQPKKVQTAVTFYVRIGAWFAHSECVLLSLMASQSEDDHRFAVPQILKLRAGEEYGDISIQEILVKPYEVPEFSIHTQSTERVVKQVTEAAAAVVGQQARDGFIRARAHHRETMPCFRSKKDMMDTSSSSSSSSSKQQQQTAAAASSSTAAAASSSQSSSTQQQQQQQQPPQAASAASAASSSSQQSAAAAAGSRSSSKHPQPPAAARRQTQHAAAAQLAAAASAASSITAAALQLAQEAAAASCSRSS